jgi:hypothetical protein
VVLLRPTLLALAVIGAAACGPPKDKNDPGFPVPPPPPPDPTTRAMPAPVMSRYQQPTALPTSTPPKRDSITEPPLGLPLPKRDEERVVRETPAEPRQPSTTATLPDEVILQLLERNRAAFVRCFKKAIEDNPYEASFKVKLRVEVDGSGALKSATTDASRTSLDACLLRVAAWMDFPASTGPVSVELPLYYQGP